jgi:2-dehydro-3-deoxyphosphooctonate aldolase (KDO 8-P synthase)
VVCFDPAMPVATVGPISVGTGHPLVVISGPCVVEGEAVMQRAALGLKEICGELGLPLIFKSSFQKDNRTAAEAHRGPGLEAGLALLARLRQEHGFPVLSDVHLPEQVQDAARVLDVLQVPALLCRQTSLLEAVARSGRALNLKKGQFSSVAAMAGAVDKVRRAGARQVLLTERGSSFGPDRLVCDLPGLPRLRALGCPVVMDAGHASNDPSEIPLLARCGVAAGADALFVECHPDPPAALCDGKRMLSLSAMERLLRELAPLARLVRES